MLENGLDKNIQLILQRIKEIHYLTPSDYYVKYTIVEEDAFPKPHIQRLAIEKLNDEGVIKIHTKRYNSAISSSVMDQLMASAAGNDKPTYYLLDMNIDKLEEKMKGLKGGIVALGTKKACKISLDDATGEVFLDNKLIGKVPVGIQSCKYLQFLLQNYPNRMTYGAAVKFVNPHNNKSKNSYGARELCFNWKRELKKKIPILDEYIEHKNGTKLI